MNSVFFIRVFVASIGVGISLSLLSNLVVLRNFAFAGLGITHSLLGGLGLGFLLGISPTVSTIVTALIVGFLISILTLKGRLTEQTAVGIIFPVFMAGGIIALFFADKYSSDLLGYLFGNPLLITKSGLMILAIFTVVVILWLWAFFKELMFMAFDMELAKASGIKVNLHHILFMLILAVAVAIASKLVGIILVSSLLVFPGATGLMIASDYRAMFLLSLLFGLCATVGGLYLAIVINLPPGATIVLLAGIIFLIILAAKRVLRMVKGAA